MSVCGSGRVFSCELKLNAIFFSGLLRSRAEMRGKDSEVYRWYKYTDGLLRRRSKEGRFCHNLNAVSHFVEYLPYVGIFS